jgi:hypothetical protein
MKPEDPKPTANLAGLAPAGGGGLSSAAQVAQLADQIGACADALHERIMREIHAYQCGPVPRKAQDTARQLLDDEQVLRQRADGLYADAATLIVHSLGAQQQHIMALTTDAAVKLKKLVKLTDAMGIVGRLLEIAGAALTANPVFIMRSLEDMHHMLDLIGLHNPPPATPAPPAPPAEPAA